MGLDMYLYLRKHESVGSWEEDFNQKKKDFYPTELKEFAKERASRDFLSKSTTYYVGYWRKANAIHNWFVENCGNRMDECQTIYVSLEDAEELLDICKQVLDNPEKAPELLPTQEGFFFGSTDYDDYYFNDLKYTIELLTKVINFIRQHKDELNPTWDITYEASW